MEVSGQLHAPVALSQVKSPWYHWIGSWVDPRAVLDAVVKRKIPSPRQESNPKTPTVQPVGQRYTDWLPLVHMLGHLNQFPTFIPYFYKIHFDILPSTPGSPTSLPLTFIDQNSKCFFHLSYAPCIFFIPSINQFWGSAW
jgi:hypothetical protein